MSQLGAISMNKIYNVVYSEEHGTWVVCSELDKRGRKKSSRTSTGKLLASAAIMGAGLASLPAQASLAAMAAQSPAAEAVTWVFTLQPQTTIKLARLW